jgi:hypothetical protein
MGKEADKYLVEFEKFLNALPGNIYSQRQGLSDSDYIRVLEFAISGIKKEILPFIEIARTLIRAQVSGRKITLRSVKKLNALEAKAERIIERSDDIAKINASLQRQLTASKKKKIVKVAPIKYLPKHFREVDRRIHKGYKVRAAIEEVSENHGFAAEGFRQQYYDRWLSQKHKVILTKK